jgi:hypothetical protein
MQIFAALCILLTLPAWAVAAEEPLNSELLFRCACGELEALVRAHLLTEIDELKTVLELPEDTVRRLQTVAAGVAHQFVAAENWGDSDHRAFFEPVNVAPFKTLKLQGRQVSLHTAQRTAIQPETLPVSVWFEVQDKRFLLGLSWGRFAKMHAVHAGLDNARSSRLWQGQIVAMLTDVQRQTIRDYRERQRKTAAVQSMLAILELDILLLPKQRPPIQEWLEQELETPDWQNRLMDGWADDLSAIYSKELKPTAAVTQTLSPQQLAAWEQHRRLPEHSSENLAYRGNSRKEALIGAIVEELQATVRNDMLPRAAEAAVMLDLDEPQQTKLRGTVDEIAKEFGQESVVAAYDYVDAPFSGQDLVRINGRPLALKKNGTPDDSKPILHNVLFELRYDTTRIRVISPEESNSYVMGRGRIQFARWHRALDEVASPERVRQFQAELRAKRQRAVANILVGSMTAPVRLNPQQLIKVTAWLESRLRELKFAPEEFDYSILVELAREIGMLGLDGILTEHQKTIWLSRIVQM